jgi:hypothetical protein
MALSFIHDFHMKLHKLLSGDEKIRLKIDRVYISVVQDAKYPFLLINILRAVNLSKPELEMFEVEFEICIFARDKNQGNLTLLADLINTKLNPKNCHFNGYIIAGMRSQSINFQRGQDLITSKLTMLYKTLIKQGN